MLLEAAYGEAEGYAQILLGHYEAEELFFDRSVWFKMPEELADAETYVNQNESEDVYFTPSVYSEKQRKREFAATTTLVYMDADACRPEKFRVLPTFSVETSPDKWQCYWLLDKPYPADVVSNLAHRIAIAHKDDGCDPSSWILTKIMRVPGTMHRKTAMHHEVSLRGVTGEVFTLDELDELYKDTPLPRAVSVTSKPMPLPHNLPSASDIVSNLPDDLTNIFLDGPTDRTKRSETRLRFQIDLLKFGFSDEWVFAACQLANGLEKFTGEGRPEQLWKEVLKAHEYAQFDDTGIDTGAGEVGAAEPADAPLGSLEFISHDEREWLYENPGFIQEYTSWAKDKSPLSAATYHRTLSVMLLSCVYGNWGYIVPKHGAMGLNIWGIIAGDTTSTRKSTSRALMRSVLRQWQKVTKLKIDIGSDFTPQALVKTLGERDGLVSWVHRDEFQGFIREIYTQNYMSGAAERLTELHDGKVMAVMRNTKELATEKEADTVFNFLAMGITKEIAGVLTESNFRSGFLPRFVWSVAEPPEWKPGHEEVAQMSEADIYEGEDNDDPRVSAFITQFRLAQRAWASTKPRPIFFTPEALERWNAWKVDTKKHIRGRSNEDIMEPARDRLSYVVWKTAALFAIHERSKVIDLSHLVRALEQAEWWFSDMVKMADMVASSDFEGKVDAIEMMLAAADGGFLPLNKIYGSKEFKKYRKGEVDECINSLEAQGRATRLLRQNVRVLSLRRREGDEDE